MSQFTRSPVACGRSLIFIWFQARNSQRTFEVFFPESLANSGLLASLRDDKIPAFFVFCRFLDLHGQMQVLDVEVRGLPLWSFDSLVNSLAHGMPTSGGGASYTYFVCTQRKLIRTAPQAPEVPRVSNVFGVPNVPGAPRLFLACPIPGSRPVSPIFRRRQCSLVCVLQVPRAAGANGALPRSPQPACAPFLLRDLGQKRSHNLASIAKDATGNTH